MTPTIRPFLMFEGNARPALDLYLSVFDDAEITELELFGAEGPGAEGTIFRGTLSFGGQELMVTDSVVEHGFTFTPASSLWVDCADREEVEAKAAALSDGGSFAMPPGDYGFSQWFAWVVDRFGVSWQLSVVREG